MSMRRKLTAAGLVAAVALGATVFLAAKPDAPATRPGDAKDVTKRTKPARSLSPGEVVKIVMNALRDNDAKDGGIAITFDFASPQNKKVTGPLERFVPMVKTPAYAPMLNHKS